RSRNQRGWLPQEAFFKAPASWTHSIRFARFGANQPRASVWSASSLLALSRDGFEPPARLTSAGCKRNLRESDRLLSICPQRAACGKDELCLFDGALRTIRVTS